MASSTLAGLASTLTLALSNLPAPDQIQDAERTQLLGVISQLQAALEPPQVAIQRFCFSHYSIAVIRVAQGMGIFDAFVESQGSEMSLKELSSKVKGDGKLLSKCLLFLMLSREYNADYLVERVMRFLSTQQLFKQTAAESYKPLPLAMAFGTGSFPGDMIKHFHNNLQMTAKLFNYFESNGYKNPEDAYDAPFQLAYNTKSHYFEWLSQNPKVQQVFNSVMTQTQTLRGTDWFDIYPVQEKLRVAPDQVLLVDIGGGVGHDLTAFKKRFPDLPGKLVLQDLPQVIDTIKDPLLEGITAVGHSMFDPQPIRGARAYYMRTVLHDWPDKQALEALARIREAMTEESVLFIHEHLMTDGLDVPAIAATLDIHMMEVFSSLERTQKEWVALVEKAGFRIVNVWNETSHGQPSALLEAVL